jgi:hypothetical protein
MFIDDQILYDPDLCITRVNNATKEIIDLLNIIIRIAFPMKPISSRYFT